ncbi:helix-turn-helix domain-containing protein [Parabacteroides merdae]|nr:helix-turn-helix domain-containing protein [Parabacteroides merdae]
MPVTFAPSFYIGTLALLFSIRPQKPSEPGRKPVCMEDLFNILSEGKAHVRVEMDAADLKAFSDELIRRAKDELGSMVEAARKERMLSKAEVKELFGVCDATLWHWDRKGILKPVKTGNKVLYPEYEVRKALGQRNQIL